MDGLFVTLTIGDITVKKTGSEALQSEGKSSKSKTFRSSKLTLHLSEHLFTNVCFLIKSDPTAKRQTRAEEGLSLERT